MWNQDRSFPFLMVSDALVKNCSTFCQQQFFTPILFSCLNNKLSQIKNWTSFIYYEWKMKHYLMIFCWTNNDHQGFVQVGLLLKIQENEISTKHWRPQPMPDNCLMHFLHFEFKQWSILAWVDSFNHQSYYLVMWKIF